MARLAVIGLGARSAAMLTEMGRLDPDVRIAAIADPDLSRAMARLADEAMPSSSGVEIFESADDLLRRADVYDAVLVGTPCALHAEMAVKVAPTGLPLFLEKPIAVTEEQLAQLTSAFAGRMDDVVVSFPLRATPLFARVLEIVGSGRLGQINQVQAVNYVPYGGVYFAHWYRDFDLAHGMWLQKATHDFDYLNLLVQAAPTSIAATETQAVYGGTEAHDLRCSVCSRAAACAESPVNMAGRPHSGGVGFGDHYCLFSRDIRNHDAGSALIRYAGGVHASYVQNFLTRNHAGKRGARVTGYLPTLDFEWYTGTITVTDHHRDNVDQVAVPAEGGHMGGDAVLAGMFLDVVAGRGKSAAPLCDGLTSVAMCVAAMRSVTSGAFEPVG